MGFACTVFATLSSALPATVPAPSGNHGMNANIVASAVIDYVVPLTIGKTITVLHRHDRDDPHSHA